MATKRMEYSGMGIGYLFLRIVVSAIVLAVAAFFTPGFSISNIWALLIAALFIGALDYMVIALTRFDAHPFGRGFVGFIISAIIIYVTGFIVPGVAVSFWGAIMAAIVIGLIDMVIPGRQVLE